MIPILALRPGGLTLGIQRSANILCKMWETIQGTCVFFCRERLSLLPDSQRDSPSTKGSACEDDLSRLLMSRSQEKGPHSLLTLLSARLTYTIPILTTIRQCRHHYSHFLDEETEAWRAQIRRQTLSSTTYPTAGTGLGFQLVSMWSQVGSCPWCHAASGEWRRSSQEMHALSSVRVLRRSGFEVSEAMRQSLSKSMSNYSQVHRMFHPNSDIPS